MNLDKLIDTLNPFDFEHSCDDSNTHFIQFDNFVGFDENWNEIYRDYADTQAVERFIEMLKKHCSFDGWSKYQCNEFTVYITFTSDDI